MTSQQNIQQALLGSWSLLEFRSQFEGGGEHFPMGEHPRGIINYFENGRMSVHLQPAVNKKVKWSAYDHLSYTGRYWVYVQPDGNVIAKHHLEVCSWPEGEGSFQTRKVELCGNRLTLLSAEPMNLEVSSITTYSYRSNCH